MQTGALRVLICTSEFASESSNPWLWDDLANALAAAGHSVDVVVHSPTSPRPRGETQRSVTIRVLSVGTESRPRGTVTKVLSYLATAWRLHRHASRWVRASTYDLGLYSSIGVFSFGFPSRMKRSGAIRTLAFLLWDFFPVHHVEIGRVAPKWLSGPLKVLERRSFVDADVIALMSEANRDYFSTYHRGSTHRTALLPPWTSDPRADAEPARFSGEPLTAAFTAVFGGQLVRGRGVETLIMAAAELRNHPDIRIVIAGQGARADDLKLLAAEAGASNVEFVGMLQRAEYRALLARAHVGVAITVEGVSAPTFPSKIAEYCANGVPVIVALESGSDAGSLIELRGAGLAVAAGDPAALARALLTLADEHRSGRLDTRRTAARALFESDFSADAAAATLTRLVGKE